MNVKNFYHTNQFIIMGDGAIWFQSYESTVAKLQGGVLTLGKYWDYSNTTMRHLYKLIEEGAIKYDSEMR